MAVVVVVALMLGSMAARTCEASIRFPYPFLPEWLNPPPSPPAPVLRYDYYKDTECSGVEDTVRRVVAEAEERQPGIGAGLIRLFFHDCFVEGCDASVLLRPTKANPQPEMLGVPNVNSLHGFNVIDDAKKALREKCEGVVSCADILAFAARDATVLLGKVKHFEMPSGRYDGRVSNASYTLYNLPPPFADLRLLKDMFKLKGFNTDEMVTLSGAHSIGVSRCSSFCDRSDNASSNMNPWLASKLRSQCTCNTSSLNAMVNQDNVTPRVLDNQYYWNVINKKVLFKSDAALLSSWETAAEVLVNALYPNKWEEKFAAAMVKMGSIDVKSKDDGEIRKVCGFVNYSTPDREGDVRVADQ
ncbi:peroxidase 2 [Brachypodium distachyon]|uniref:Peroxidase n=1 Tax=Brachypodium distachyon TaxID=15368 RepID=A0A0Q3GVJ5_BRADI|nr:peroxidase 2 [Brachypodium distachyon]KQK14991.1 hypothetical protein BRADI_1g20005v3 [Brachypodium distachyon]|eukprot:XP_003559902.1 peroxidase 2 [Brachypodium distachyon]